MFEFAIAVAIALHAGHTVIGTTRWGGQDIEVMAVDFTTGAYPTLTIAYLDEKGFYSLPVDYVVREWTFDL